VLRQPRGLVAGLGQHRAALHHPRGRHLEQRDADGAGLDAKPRGDGAAPIAAAMSARSVTLRPARIPPTTARRLSSAQVHASAAVTTTSCGVQPVISRQSAVNSPRSRWRWACRP
jgi:hypothetical protein